MKSKLTIALALMALLACVATATATAGGLRVIGSARSSGDFAVTAASGSKKNTHSLWVRGYGQAVVACSRGFSIGSRSTSLNSMRSGRLYKLRLPMHGDCDVTASLSGSGRIRLQILAV
jgi:hypothetical protein